METYLKTLDRLEPGDNAGVLVKGEFTPLLIDFKMFKVSTESNCEEEWQSSPPVLSNQL